MDEKPKSKSSGGETPFSRQVGAKESRKLKARREATQGVWFSLGMLGIIGWSVVIPTLIGVVLGLWLDGHYRGSYSWTLMLMILGLIIGCLNAWHWVAKEEKEMREEEGERHD